MARPTPKVFDRDLVRIRNATLTVATLYPTWHYILQFCFPGSIDHWPIRISISLYGLGLFSLTFRPAFSRTLLRRLYMSTSFLCMLHIGWLTAINHWTPDFQLLYVMTVIAFAGVVISEAHFYTYCAALLLTTPIFMYTADAPLLSMIVVNISLATPLFALWIFVRSSFQAEETLSAQALQVSNNSRLAALGELSSSIAHEINNPLAIIQGKAGLALRLTSQNEAGEKNAELQKHLEAIVRAVQRSAKIVRSLRVLSRSGANDPLTPIPWNQLWATIMELCNERFRNSGVALTLIGDTNVNVNCRESQVVQILVNLLNNAHDAISGQSTKWVIVELKENKKSVEIRVTDSGTGIPLELQDKIMAPFFTTKASGQGTGLGLSLSQNLAQENDGSLTLDPLRPNTTFVLTLRLSTEAIIPKAA